MINKKIKIFVATHKKANFPKDKIYVPIHVGAEGKADLKIIKDNVGENISIKNSNYCELTGLYWIWKNDTSDIVGLVHYRRYFFNNYLNHEIDKIITKKDVEEYLNKYDVIVPKKNKILMYKNVKDSYDKIHCSEDLNKCKKIIESKYPQYLESFNKVLNRKWLYAYNMFIMKRGLLDNYCKWLFNILFELEKEIDISSYDNYNKRIYGFLSERLFNVWLEKNYKYKIKELVVYNTDDNFIKQLSLDFIKNILVRGKK